MNFQCYFLLDFCNYLYETNNLALTQVICNMKISQERNIVKILISRQLAWQSKLSSGAGK